MHRRELIKISALSVAGLSLRDLRAAASATVDAPPKATGSSPLPPPPTATSPLMSRARPPCLDLNWAAGAGLIWMAGETPFYDNPRNRYMRFRRTFNVPEGLSRAELRLFADTHYIVWLNGVELGRGPGRSDPTWTYFDTYDVAARLKPGANTLAVLALFHGFGSGGRQSMMQALLAHLELATRDGRRQAIVSDRSWKTSPAEEFIRPSPRLHATLGCMEVQDRRRADEGWEQPGYDDSAWRNSDYVKPNLAITPWYHFVPEPLPHRVIDDLPFPPEVRLAKIAFPPPPVDELGVVRPILTQGSAAALPLALPAGTEGVAHVVTLDLGRDECGYFSLEVEGPAGATIDLLCGEMLIDGRLPKPGTARVHTTRFLLRDGRQTLNVAFNWLAFRYAQLWIWTPAPLKILGANLRRLSLPLGAGGHFSCDDEFLNRLDGICEHTLRLCAQDGIVDSSSREQQQWIGDGRFTAITLHHRFSVGVLHRRLIEQVGQGIDWTGSLVPRFPTGNLNVSPIPLFSLHWVLAFRDYAWFTGNGSLARDWWVSILLALRWFTAFERADGLLERVPHWMYIELGEGPPPGRVPSTGVVNATLNLHYLSALRSAAELARTFGEAGNAAHFTSKADKLAAAIREVLWDESIGVYRDSLGARGEFGTLSEGTNAQALIHLEEPDTLRSRTIVEAVFERPRNNPIQASPFAMNGLLEALSLHGRADLVISLLKSRYAPQLESGSTWEYWRSHDITNEGIPEVHSLSHAWGAAPLAFFVNTIAGIRPASPGWGKVRIAPQPASLRRAAASVVTPLGKIETRWEITGGRFELHATLPSGVSGEYVLPDGSTGSLATGASTVQCRWAEKTN